MSSMDTLIYNQKDIPRAEHRYGFRASADVGCGWIATWNALMLLGCRTDLDELIRYYEWQLPLIHGNAGTSFWGPAVCFRKWGFSVNVLTERKKFDQAAREADVSILFYRWRKKVKLGAHFVALHHKDGQFIGYNTYSNSTGPDLYGDSLEGFLKERKYFGCILTTISRK